MQTVAARNPRVKVKGDFKKNLPLLALTLPGIVYLIINNYIPMFGIFIAFKQVNFAKGLFRSDWIGFKNFEFLFATDSAFIMIRNTLLYNVAFILLGTVLALIIAVLMSDVSRNKAAKFFQASLVLPSLISMVIVSYLVYAFLGAESGMFNSILKSMGKPTISYYTQPKYWPFVLTIVQLWKSAGYQSIVFIAAIAGIDQEMYESSRIDGAGKFKQIFQITLPQIVPMLTIMLLMSATRIFASDFGLFYQVPQNSGALFSVTQTIDTYVYRGLMQRGDTGMSSAAGLFQSAVGFVLVVTANAIVRRTNQENALF
jgi:putative aldouronate transport system permease protein